MKIPGNGTGGPGLQGGNAPPQGCASKNIGKQAKISSRPVFKFNIERKYWEKLVDGNV